jgi:hypothetical protein
MKTARCILLALSLVLLAGCIFPGGWGHGHDHGHSEYHN